MTSARYMDIADQLAGELAACAPGTRVASEPELASRFGVGRAAARSALQELERRLLVRRIQGAGTFVNRRIDYVISRNRPPSWHATVIAGGGTPRSQTKEVQRIGLAAEDSAQLGWPAGTRCTGSCGTSSSTTCWRRLPGAGPDRGRTQSGHRVAERGVGEHRAVPARRVASGTGVVPGELGHPPRGCCGAWASRPVTRYGGSRASAVMPKTVACY